MADNPLVKADEKETWAAIVERITDSLSEGEAPEDVIRAAELMLAGFSQADVAKKLGVTRQTVRMWLNKYPALAAAVADNRKLLSKWRLAQLEQLFLTAIIRSKEILEVGLDGQTDAGARVDPKVLTVLAAQARYFIGIFAAQQQQGITVTHELGETVMKAQENALDYLAQQLNAQVRNADQEPIEAVYRVIDPKLDATGPVLDENGEPFYGAFGKADKDEDGMLCSICGKRIKNMQTHLSTRHGMTTSAYEVTFMLDHGTINAVSDYDFGSET